MTYIVGDRVHVGSGKILWKVCHVNADGTLTLIKVNVNGDQLIGTRYFVDVATLRPAS